MKKPMIFSVLFLMVIISISLFESGPPAIAQDEPPLTPLNSREPMPLEWPQEPGAKPDLIGGKKADRPYVFIEEAQTTETQSAAAGTIDVWYGDPQKFGNNGNPQQWVNIMGNVSGVKVKTLTYTLNGGDEQSLSVGKTMVRLIKTGDFNIEIDYADLNDGANTVEITLTGSDDTVTKKSVTVNYSAGNVWPTNYMADWGPSTNIQDFAQVVDGKWALESGKLVLKEIGYDRLVAIGDETWTDYEVTVPVTVNGLEPGTLVSGPGIGLLMRWQGHNQDPDLPEQPRKDFQRVGAIGWYRWTENEGEGLGLLGYYWNHGTNTEEIWEFGEPYIIKMSVQGSTTEERAYYRLKFWKQADPEPFTWGMEGWSKLPASPDDLFIDSGSVVLLAHHLEAEFGPVQVKNLKDLKLTLTTTENGNGTVEVDPPGITEFNYGDPVLITALPEQGYVLDSWSGDLTGDENPLVFIMTKDMDITANFVEAQPGTITVNIVGEGSVSKNPDKPIYDGGEEVSLTAIPEPGYKFSEWSGDLLGTQNPAVIEIAGDKTVTATFVESNEAAPYSDNFDRCELNTELWTIVNPAEDGTVVVEGGVAKLAVPAGAAHTLYQENRDALRIMQDAEDQDLLLEAKFDSLPEKSIQIEGILIEQDKDNWIRLDVFSEDGQLSLFSGSTVGGTWLKRQTLPVDLSGATALYLRINRSGDTWTPSYSIDGSDWKGMISFDQIMTVSKAGVFAGNEPDGTAPGFVALVDYFRNVSYPEGGGYTITVDEVGQGMVKLTPESESYFCGQEVEVEAVPDSGWYFVNWSGDASGSSNPFKITLDADKSYTATFLQEGQEIEYLSFLPVSLRP